VAPTIDDLKTAIVFFISVPVMLAISALLFVMPAIIFVGVPVIPFMPAALNTAITRSIVIVIISAANVTSAPFAIILIGNNCNAQQPDSDACGNAAMTFTGVGSLKA